MHFNEHTKLGEIMACPATKAILFSYLPQLKDSPYLSFLKRSSLAQLAENKLMSGSLSEHLPSILKDLAHTEVLLEPERVYEPSEHYEAADVEIASAALEAPGIAEKWGIFELAIKGPKHGNPFVDVQLFADFKQNDQTITVRGFYDGDGMYRVRFMPGTEGVWQFTTSSNARSLHQLSGEFLAVPAAAGNNGPVRVANTFHFAYENGKRFIPVGTTCYVWNHQPQALQAETLASLKHSPFNKLRMCTFPKSYQYNNNEPELFPYEGSLENGFDYTRFNPRFFRQLDEQIAALCELGVEADLILFHAYDRWGFSEMSKQADNRYLQYVVARLAAYRNIWWSLANEYDLMWAKEEEDWERFAAIVTSEDPYKHLLSIHNCHHFYDYSRPWVTHCSVQRVDVYKTAEYTDQWRKQWNKPIVIDECAYEGNIDMGWGNITGEEMVRRFWEGAVRGGYVGHGETYLNDEEILWWSKGGKLHGTSPARIAFLRGIMEEGPSEGLNPYNAEWDAASAAVIDHYYLYYYGFNRPSYRLFSMTPAVRFHVDIIDTWNMTITRLPNTVEGTFRIELPARQYMAIRLIRAEEALHE